LREPELKRERSLRKIDMVQDRHLLFGRVRKPSLLLLLITVAALAPFLGKAFHIDDPLFIWMAQQIAKHPLDPYGFEVNWASFPEPMWQQMQNPPLCSYYIALVGSVFGWSEIALHVAFLFWATMSILGTFALARRFCPQPFLAALLTLFTPVFLVSATNVMCDVMLLALWVWSIELWLRGLDSGKWTMSILSALLAAAAVLTKYFGIALVPLLGVYTILREPKKWTRLLFLMIPIAAAAAFEFWTKSQYGRGLFTAAMFFARGASKTFGQAMPAQLLIGLAFLGGSLVAPAFQGAAVFNRRPKPNGGRGDRRSLIVFAAILLLALTCFYLLVPIDPGWALGSNEIAVRIEGGVFAAIGFGILALVIVDLTRDRSAETWLLFLWLIGTFAFVTFFNWSITARTILPIAPVAAIVIVRHFSIRAWQIVAVAIISFIVAAADYRQANSAREAAHTFEQRFRSDPGKIWFQSHWGFQYYMQQWGATPLNARDSEIASGDVMIVPANNVLIVSLDAEKAFTPEQINFAVLPFVSTLGRGTGASFYSSIRGPIPWAINRVGPEMYYVARFR
jgi:4-amino-4-deoxy-L-arabinose transferase-like glycosyltransferase